MPFVGNFGQLTDEDSADFDFDAQESNDSKKKPNEEYSDIDIFANEVVAKIVTDGVPLLPSNYDIYFRRLLEKKPREFQDNILKLTEIEDPTNEEKLVNLEKKAKKNLFYTNRLIKSLSLIYRNSTDVKNAIENSLNQLNSGDIINAKSSVNSLKNNLEIAHLENEKYLGTAKQMYQNSVKLVENIDDNAIYDNEYGLYSKSYFLKILKKEYAIAKNSQKTASILMMKLHSSVSSKIKSQKIKKTISRMIAKLLHKSSKRTDMVAHYGNDVFLIVLNKTDLFGAEMAAKRLKAQLASNSIFVGENEYSLVLGIGIVELNSNITLKENMSCLIQNLKIADKNSSLDFSSCKKEG